MKMSQLLITGAVLACTTLPVMAQPGGQGDQDTSMSFFITSAGPGDGANLGGLAGADAHCTALAESVGVNGKTWRAYLSTTGPSGVYARDRIGSGPWYNSEGALAGRGVMDIHYSNANLNKQVSLTESGGTVNGVGDQPNMHDVLTGSNPDGTSSGLTCNNWTSNTDQSSATVGHFDRIGGGAMAESWNAAHTSRGCSQEQLQASGGNGFYYCFATGE